MSILVGCTDSSLNPGRKRINSMSILCQPCIKMAFGGKHGLTCAQNTSYYGS